MGRGFCFGRSHNLGIFRNIERDEYSEFNSPLKLALSQELMPQKAKASGGPGAYAAGGLQQDSCSNRASIGEKNLGDFCFCFPNLFKRFMVFCGFILFKNG